MSTATANQRPMPQETTAQHVTPDAIFLDEIVARTKYSDQDRDLIRRTICQDATKDEFEMFMKYAERTGLDPFARQICMVKRKGRCTIQTQIDGFRLVADRTRLYAGNDAPTYEGEGLLLKSRTHPLKAKNTVYKLVAGKKEPFSAEARWDEFAPEISGAEAFMWRKMPFHMLGKVAEALALRKAFPADLSGMYTAEEMHQAGSGDEDKRTCTVQQAEYMNDLRLKLGWSIPDMGVQIKQRGYETWRKMPAREADSLIMDMEVALSEKRDPLAEGTACEAVPSATNESPATVSVGVSGATTPAQDRLASPGPAPGGEEHSPEPGPFEPEQLAMEDDIRELRDGICGVESEQERLRMAEQIEKHTMLSPAYKQTLLQELEARWRHVQAPFASAKGRKQTAKQ